MPSRLPFVLLLLTPAVALAGMPSFMLTEVASLRFQAISFFLVLFLLVSLAVRALWNRLGRDVPRLPQLGFGSALALVFLWGLGFQLVLSMIAGGRELMTPGAWEKKGAIYELKQTELPSEKELVSRRGASGWRSCAWRCGPTRPSTGASSPRVTSPRAFPRSAGGCWAARACTSSM